LSAGGVSPAGVVCSVAAVGCLLAGLAGDQAPSGIGPGAHGPPRFAANAIPPARIDMVNPRDSEAMEDRPDDVSILWKNAVSSKKVKKVTDT